MAWRCREWLEAKDCKLIEDDEGISRGVDNADLHDPVKRAYQGRRQVGIEGPRSQSPNLADAWNNTFAEISLASQRLGQANQRQHEIHRMNEPKRRGRPPKAAAEQAAQAEMVEVSPSQAYADRVWAGAV